MMRVGSLPLPCKMVVAILYGLIFVRRFKIRYEMVRELQLFNLVGIRITMYMESFS